MNVKKRHVQELVARRQPNIPMPEGFAYYNGGVRCDMVRGPCACGSWHQIDDWPFDFRVAIRRHLKQHQ